MVRSRSSARSPNEHQDTAFSTFCIHQSSFLCRDFDINFLSNITKPYAQYTDARSGTKDKKIMISWCTYVA